MRKVMLAVLAVVLASGALAQQSASATSDDTRNSDQAKEKAEAADAKDPDEFVLPPGFKAKKRGDITLYCTKGKATGTRFQTESCYDEAQLRDYLLAREQNNRDFDRSRAICSNPSICAPQ